MIWKTSQQVTIYFPLRKWMSYRECKLTLLLLSICTEMYCKCSRLKLFAISEGSKMYTFNGELPKEIKTYLSRAWCVFIIIQNIGASGFEQCLANSSGNLIITGGVNSIFRSVWLLLHCILWSCLSINDSKVTNGTIFFKVFWKYTNDL